MTPMLTITDYSDKILTNITLTLREDENLIILGSNGAGKSTLAKILCGITYSQAVEIEGERIAHLSAKSRAKKINYVPPKLEIFDAYIGVRDFLVLSRLHGEMGVEEVIGLLELDLLGDASCQMLSSGEQQRLLLASSLLHGARITIYDEPTANLDPKRTVEVYEILQSDKIASRIIITHDLTLAFRLGYRVVYMDEGRILFDGERDAFFEVSNLRRFFGDSLKQIDDYFVVNI
jgi:iron complex transport system ATP-binding protein